VKGRINVQEDRDPFEEILELESRIKEQEISHGAEVIALRKELSEVKDQIKDLIELIIAIKGFVKAIGYIEKLVLFLTKISAYGASMYIVYRFGVLEIWNNIKAAGGK
jgi:hypothetical protein